MLSSIVDCTLVLTLASRKDRHRTIFHHLKDDLGMENVYLYTVEGNRKKQQNNGGDRTIGLMEILTHSATDETSNDIFKNHIAMIRWAYERGYQRVLFLEEDARFDSIDEAMIRRAGAWMDHNEWDIFYVGYCTWPIVAAFPVAINIVRLPSPYLCHAYIMNRTGMEKILNYPASKDMHIDKFLATMPNLIKVGIYPSICFQENEPALYEEAKKKLHIPLSFRTMSRTLEMVAVLWPIVFIFILCFYLILRYKRTV